MQRNSLASQNYPRLYTPHLLALAHVLARGLLLSSLRLHASFLAADNTQTSDADHVCERPRAAAPCHANERRGATCTSKGRGYRSWFSLAQVSSGAVCVSEAEGRVGVGSWPCLLMMGKSWREKCVYEASVGKGKGREGMGSCLCSLVMNESLRERT